MIVPRGFHVADYLEGDGTLEALIARGDSEVYLCEYTERGWVCDCPSKRCHHPQLAAREIPWQVLYGLANPGPALPSPKVLTPKERRIKGKANWSEAKAKYQASR